MPVDSRNGRRALDLAWRASGRRLAVTFGAATGLISLLNNTPVRVASLRGAVAWGVVLSLTSIGAWVLSRAYEAPPAPDLDNEDEIDHAADAALDA